MEPLDVVAPEGRCDPFVRPLDTNEKALPAIVPAKAVASGGGFHFCIPGEEKPGTMPIEP